MATENHIADDRKKVRLIDANALIEFLRKRTAVTYPNLYPGLFKAIEYIQTFETVDAVEVVRGFWVGTADGYADGELVYDMWECSECGYDADGADEKPNWNYCPNCGAKMDGDGNG